MHQHRQLFHVVENQAGANDLGIKRAWVVAIENKGHGTVLVAALTTIDAFVLGHQHHGQVLGGIFVDGQLGIGLLFGA